MGSLFVLLLLAYSCSNPAPQCLVDSNVRITELKIDTNASPCQADCECNNLRYEGLCIKGKCTAVKRSACSLAKGEEAACVRNAKLGRCDGARICQPPYLKEKLWGDCICPTQGESLDEKTPQDKQFEKSPLEQVLAEKNQENPKIHEESNLTETTVEPIREVGERLPEETSPIDAGPEVSPVPEKLIEKGLVCSVGEQKCVGNDLHTCKSDMSGWDIKPCGRKATCVGKTCRAFSADLLLHWKLDETTGKKANDSSGHQRHGIIGSAVKLDLSGKIGKAFGLNGSDDSRVIYNSRTAFLLANSGYTAMLWVKSKAKFGPLLSNGDPAKDGQSGWSIEISNGTLKLLHKGKDNTGTTDISDDKWHHLAVSRTSGGQVTLYIDGKVESTGKEKDKPPAIKRLELGRRNQGKQLFLAGLVDDVRLYNRAMTKNEIVSIMSP